MKVDLEMLREKQARLQNLIELLEEFAPDEVEEVKPAKTHRAAPRKPAKKVAARSVNGRTQTQVLGDVLASVGKPGIPVEDIVVRMKRAGFHFATNSPEDSIRTCIRGAEKRRTLPIQRTTIDGRLHFYMG